MKNKLNYQIFHEKNDPLFTYTNYETFGLKNKKIIVPKTFTYREFVKNTSIATSTMVKRNVIKNINYRYRYLEDYFLNATFKKR